MLTCSRCGSHHLRRSLPRNTLESFARAVTPLRFHRCADCEGRGIHLGWSAPKAARSESLVPPVPPGRRRERRDATAARVRSWRTVRSILLAALLGALAASRFLAG